MRNYGCLVPTAAFCGMALFSVTYSCPMFVEFFPDPKTVSDDEGEYVEIRLDEYRAESLFVRFESKEIIAFEWPEAERLLRAFPFELSGGMAQRVTIALAACAAPRLVIADEPTNGLDRRATEEFFRLLDRLFPKAARLIITHDISVAARCGRAAVLCGGIACETGPCAEVLSDPKHPYTRALLNALPQNGMAETPRLREGEAMCPFYARCPQARELCRTQMTPGAKGLRKWRCSGL